MERCYELRRSTTIQLPNITDITFLKLWDMVLLNLEKIRRHISLELWLIKLIFEMHVKPGENFSFILIFLVEWVLHDLWSLGTTAQR